MLNPQHRLFDLDGETEQHAQDIVHRLRARGWSPVQSAGTSTTEVELDSMEHEQARSVGGERMAVAALEQLGWRERLESLGVSERDAKLATALVVARMLHPGSEREALRWMREDSAILEVLALDQHLPPSLNKLYRLNDLVWKHREALQQGRFERERTLLDLPSTVLFYDLTHVHYHGRHNESLVCFGRSKQKRNDGPLISLALALDTAGFPCDCEILPGNVSEPKTLRQAMKTLSSRQDGAPVPTVVMDAGIATQDNLEWLSEQGYPWIVVSRQAKPEAPRGPADVQVEKASNGRVQGWRLESTETEVTLYVYSEDKQKTEDSILHRKRQRFESEIQGLHEGWSKPRGIKRLDKVHQRIGRIKQKYSKVSAHYDLEVVPADNGIHARSVHGREQPRYQEADRQSGGVVLRSSQVQWSTEQIIRTYWQLTDIEATFRSLKSELGLRPIFHQLDHRIRTHLLISVFAYHAVQLIRVRLKAQQMDLSWKSIRNCMRSWQRITTTLKSVHGSSIIQRQDVRPNVPAEQIARAWGMNIQLHRHRT